MKKKASPAEIIVSVILLIIFIPVIVVNVSMIVQTYIHPEHLPSVMKYSPVVVLSGSMSPTFEAGSLIFIEDVDTGSLQVGDIICYMENGATAVTHRINEVVTTDGQLSFITKGDANNTTDSMSVLPSQVEGRYVGHVNKVGNAVMFMQSTTGMILFVALPMILYIAVDFLLSRKENRADRRRADELEAELAALKAQQRGGVDS